MRRRARTNARTSPGGAAVRVKATDLYWQTLGEHRDAPHYRLLRFKLLHFVANKLAPDPALLKGDRPFQNPVLKGIWHYKLLSKPEITLFYTRGDGVATLCMLGDHSDYGFKGRAATAEARTASRVNNAAARPEAPSPGWPGVRWQDPLDLLHHPDLPELSGAALIALLDELNAEAETGARFERRHGVGLLDAGEEVFERYLEDIIRCQDLVASLRRNMFRHAHWIENLPEANEFRADARRVPA